jgi:hypothetical protein
VKVRRTLLHREREACSLDPTMALRARLAPIRWIRPGRSAPFAAGIENESIQARLHSILSASPSLSSSSWWGLCHPPRFFQSRSLRQQVTPEPQPISGESMAPGMPLLSTKRMPRNASRLETGGRPPAGLGRCSGSKGRMLSHNSSETNGFDIVSDSITQPSRG